MEYVHGDDGNSQYVLHSGLTLLSSTCIVNIAITYNFKR